MNNVFIQDNLTNKSHNVFMNALNYVKKEYYLKKVFYGNYVKNIVLPLELFNNNPRNKTGIKNTGKNDKKLWNSRIRSQGNCIRKAYENFWNCKNLIFLTLTYAVNETNVKKCKNDLKLFFNNINRWWNNHIRSKHHKGVLKYIRIIETKIKINFQIANMTAITKKTANTTLLHKVITSIISLKSVTLFDFIFYSSFVILKICFY